MRYHPVYPVALPTCMRCSHVLGPAKIAILTTAIVRSYDEYGTFAAETVRVDFMTQSACWAASCPCLCPGVCSTTASGLSLSHARQQVPRTAGCLRDLKEQRLLVWRAEGEDWEPTAESDDEEDVDAALATIDMRELGAISREAEARLGCSVEEAALQARTASA